MQPGRMATQPLPHLSMWVWVCMRVCIYACNRRGCVSSAAAVRVVDNLLAGLRQAVQGASPGMRPNALECTSGKHSTCTVGSEKASSASAVQGEEAEKRVHCRCALRACVCASLRMGVCGRENLCACVCACGAHFLFPKPIHLLRTQVELVRV